MVRCTMNGCQATKSTARLFDQRPSWPFPVQGLCTSLVRKIRKELSCRTVAYCVSSMCQNNFPARQFYSHMYNKCCIFSKGAKQEAGDRKQPMLRLNIVVYK